MSSDKTNESESHMKFNPRKRPSLDEDNEPVKRTGTGPLVVLNHSAKMSIYGPHFNYGPIQLRKQRLEAKWRKEKELKLEADRVLEQKIAELTAAHQEKMQRAAPNTNVDQRQIKGEQEELAKRPVEIQAQFVQQQTQYYGCPGFGGYQYSPQETYHQIYQPNSYEQVSYEYGHDIDNNNGKNPYEYQHGQQNPTDLHNNKF